MRYLPLILILVSVVSCQPAQQRTEELLMRKWKYDLEAIRKDLFKDPVSDRQVNYMEGVMARLKDATLEFKPEGKMTLHLNGQDMPGYWEVNKAGDILTINLTGIPQPSVIVELTSELLVMRQETETEMNFNRFLVPAD